MANKSADPKETERPAQVAALNAAAIPAIARIERVSEAAVKAAVQSLGNDRAKVLAAIRSAKTS